MKPEIQTFCFKRDGRRDIKVDTMRFERKQDGRKVLIVLPPHNVFQLAKWQRRYARIERKASSRIYAKTIPVANPIKKHRDIEDAVEKLSSAKRPTFLSQLRRRFGFA